MFLPFLTLEIDTGTTLKGRKPADIVSLKALGTLEMSSAVCGSLCLIRCAAYFNGKFSTLTPDISNISSVRNASNVSTETQLSSSYIRNGRNVRNNRMLLTSPVCRSCHRLFTQSVPTVRDVGTIRNYSTVRTLADLDDSRASLDTLPAS